MWALDWSGVNISRLTGARMYTLYRNSVNRPDQVQGRSSNQTQRGGWVLGEGEGSPAAASKPVIRCGCLSARERAQLRRSLVSREDETMEKRVYIRASIKTKAPMARLCMMILQIQTRFCSPGVQRTHHLKTFVYHFPSDRLFFNEYPSCLR